MKKTLVILLAILVALFSFPLMALAAGQNEYYNWQSNGKVKEDFTLAPGGVRGIKTVTATENINEYRVDIKVESVAEGKTQQRGILFLIDTSDHEDLSAYKQVLKQVLPGVLLNTGNHVSIAQIGDKYSQLTSFSGAESQEKLLSTVENMESSSKLYLEHGVREARKELITSGFENLSLVILTSGNASVFTKLNSVESKVICNEDHSVQQWEITPVYDKDRVPVTSLGFNQRIIPQADCQNDRTENHGGKYPFKHIDTAVYESKLAVDSGIDVFIGGESISANVYQELTTMQNKGFAKDSEGIISLLDGAFNNNETLTEKMDITITDELLEYVNIGENINVSTGSGSYENGLITWTLSGNGELSYNFIWDVENEKFSHSEYIAVGKETVIEYEKDGNTEEIYLNQPFAKSEFLQIFIQGIWVDENNSKNMLNEEGKIATSIEEAYKVSEKTDFLNANGVNRWNPNRKVTVESDRLKVMDGFEIHPDGKQTIELDLSELDKNPVVYFIYQKHQEENTSKNYTINILHSGISSEAIIIEGIIEDEGTEMNLSKLQFPDKEFVVRAVYFDGKLLEDYVEEDYFIRVTEGEHTLEFFYEQVIQLEQDYEYRIIYTCGDDFLLPSLTANGTYDESGEAIIDARNYIKHIEGYKISQIVLDGIIKYDTINSMGELYDDCIIHFSKPYHTIQMVYEEIIEDGSGDGGSGDDGSNINQSTSFYITSKLYSFENSLLTVFEKQVKHYINTPVNLWAVYGSQIYEGENFKLENVTIDSWSKEEPLDSAVLGMSGELYSSAEEKFVTKQLSENEYYIFSKDLYYTVYLDYKLVIEQPSNTVGEIYYKHESTEYKAVDKQNPSNKLDKSVPIETEISKNVLEELGRDEKTDVTTYSDIGFALPKTGRRLGYEKGGGNYRLLFIGSLILSHYVLLQLVGGLVVNDKKQKTL